MQRACYREGQREQKAQRRRAGVGTGAGGGFWNEAARAPKGWAVQAPASPIKGSCLFSRDVCFEDPCGQLCGMESEVKAR